MNEYLLLLRKNQNYRFLWLGSVISQLGDWFNLIASAELITEITNTGIAISYLFLARFLPLFLFSPLAGVLADRYNRRTILIVSDLLRALTVLGFLLVRSQQHVWLLYALTVLQFALSALFTPARSAVLANVVAPDDLVTANALDSFTWSTMLALGAFLGGAVAAVFGRETAFVMDAATFLLSAWVISRVAVPVRQRGGLPDQGGWLDFIDGFRYLWQEPFILGISLVKGAGSLIWGAINVLEVTFADQVFPLQHPAIVRFVRAEDSGTAALGLIYVVSGLGTGLGPLLLRRWLGEVPLRLMWGITAGFVLMASGILALSVAPTFPLFLLGTLTRTVGTGTVWVFSAVLLQMLIPDRFRGRVFAFEFTVLTLTQSISILGAGFFQDQFSWGVRQVSALFGFAGWVVGALWLIFFWRALPGVKSRRIWKPANE